MTSFLRASALAALALLSSACGGAKFVVMGTQNLTNGPVRIIAAAPNSPPFVNALAGQLSQRGYSTIDARTTEALVASLGGGGAFGLAADPTQDPRTMGELSKRHVDVVMSAEVQRVGMGTTQGKILTAKIRLAGTRDAGAVSEVSWENAWGGMPGSPADASMRMNDDRAAGEIANNLLPLLGSPGPKEVLDIATIIRSAPHGSRREREGSEEPPEREEAPRRKGDSSGEWWKDDQEPAERKTVPPSAGPPQGTTTREPRPEPEAAPEPEPAEEAPKPRPKPSAASVDELLP